jgi:glycosyltransferase involved in cell wall biosynthesis
VPEVSVVMGVRDGGEPLAASVESILAQRGVEIELLVVDDGSTDGTIERLEQRARREARLRILRRPPEGLTAALAAGCAAARAPLVARQDAGDQSHPERLRLLRDAFARFPELVLAACRTLCLGPGGEPLYVEANRGEREAPTPLLAFEPPQVVAGPSSHGAAMFRADAYRAAGGYRAEFALGQDWDLWQRLGLAGPFLGLSHVHYIRTLGLDSLSFAFRDLQREFGRLSIAAARRRAAGQDDADLLAAARRLGGRMAAEHEARRPRGRAAGAYHVGEILRRRGDRRAAGYFRLALRHRATVAKAAVRLLQCRFAPLAPVWALDGGD